MAGRHFKFKTSTQRKAGWVDILTEGEGECQTLTIKRKDFVVVLLAGNVRDLDNADTIWREIKMFVDQERARQAIPERDQKG